MKTSWGINFLRDIGFNIFDRGIYGILELFYDLFTTISRMTILSNDTIAAFASRLYAIIAIFMLFKATFSLLSLFVDPDKLSDSKVGAGKIVQRIITSLVLITLVPTIFQMAYGIQRAVLSENIIGNIILGIDTKTPGKQSIEVIQKNAGKTMGVTIFKGFFKPFKGVTLTPEQQKLYDEASSIPNFSKFGTLVNAHTSGGEYVMDYSVFFSSIAGGFTAWIIMMFCFDIAIRSIKLSFLQLIAPIPILNYIDPKSGDTIFKKWVSTCVSTYADVFSRLAIIYFVIFIISEITAGPGIINVYDTTTNLPMKDVGLFAGAFIIMGLLSFAQEAPKLISDILGIKMGSGKFTMNPLKKISDSVPKPLKAAGAMTAAGATGAVMSAASKYNATKQLGGSTSEALRSAAGGAATGVFKGGAAGLKSGGKGNPFTMGQKVAAQAARSTYANAGTTTQSRMDAKFANAFGLDTNYAKMDKQTKVLDTYSKFKDDIQAATQEDKDVRAFKQMYDDSVAGGSFSEIETARTQYEEVRDQYINKVITDPIQMDSTQVGAVLKKSNAFYDENATLLEKLEYANPDGSTTKAGKYTSTTKDPTTGKDTTLGSNGKNSYSAKSATARTEKTKIENSAEYEQAKRTDTAVKPSK